MSPPKIPRWMVRPDEWGATIDYLNWTDRYVPKDKLAVHYEGGPQPANELSPELQAQLDDLLRKMPERPKFWRRPWRWIRWYDSLDFLAQVEREKRVCRGIEAYHLGKGWRGGAYSGVIGPSGTFYIMRWMNYTAAHYSGTDDIDKDGTDENAEAFATMLILGGAQEPQRYAWRTLKKVRRWLQRKMRVVIMPFGHKEIAWSGGHNTSCPGPVVMPRIERRWGTLAYRLANTGRPLP